MRIEKVSTLVVNAGRRNWVLVRIDTDQPGLIGWGEASLEVKTRGVVGAVEDFVPLLVGEDPRRIEHLWQVLYRQQFFRGGPVELSALSGIDMALWDIVGKDLGVPIWRLLGGPVRDFVRFYDHLGGGEAHAIYHDSRAEAFAARALETIAAGFDALKILPVGRARLLDNSAVVGEAIALVSAVREAVGPDVDVMVDLHGRTSSSVAIEVGRAIAPLRPWFIEEPCPPEDLDGYVRVARALEGTPIAGGERWATRWGFRPAFEREAISVAQPDVCHAGGISETRRIAALAETYNIAVAPHNPLGPIATMANLQLAFATPNHLIQEVFRADVPWRDEVVHGVPAIVNGRMSLPTDPGLGIVVDVAAAARHPYEPEPQYRWFHSDGSVADW